MLIAMITISVSKGTLQSLKLSHSDVVHVRGKNRKATLLIIHAHEDTDDGNAKTVAVVRYNLGVNDCDKILLWLVRVLKA